MTGAELRKIAEKALDWAKADQRRRELRAEWVAAVVAGKPAVIARTRKAYISAGMSTGGHKRGLLSICNTINARGIAR